MMNLGELRLRSRIIGLAQEPAAKVALAGVATVVVAPIILPLLKPALKAGLKTGVVLFEKTKAAIAETGEMIADIAAEARAEALAEARVPLGLTASAPGSEVPPALNATSPEEEHRLV
jgi:hypothetical protein